MSTIESEIDEADLAIDLEDDRRAVKALYLLAKQIISVLGASDPDSNRDSRFIAMYEQTVGRIAELAGKE